MPTRKNKYLIPVMLGIFVLVGLILLWPTPKASAQCGSQASSCKNCHEVQAQQPVNSDGTGWHQSHAFGDFCYVCHAGNNQSMEKELAHEGMVHPLSDINAGCQSCHPNDLMERAQVYATALNFEIGSGGGSAPSAGGSGDIPGGDTSGAGSDGGQAVLSAPGMVIDEADVIDYNMIFSGRTPVNWGNVILGVLIATVALGGGTFVYSNERKLRGLPTSPLKKAVQPQETPAIQLPEIEGYAPEVVELLPKIAQLNPVGLHALHRLLENPEEASELLHSLSRLDPELVRRIRSLDRESRAILLALSGD